MIVSEDRKYIRDISYNTADEFLRAISYGGELYCLQQKNYIFRGHESDKYRLLPTALRDSLFLDEVERFNIDEKIIAASLTEFIQISVESQKLKEFFDICDDRGLGMPEVRRFRDTKLLPFDLWTFITQEDWLSEELESIAALAQHHGIPTRLLDWTKDINTALYFASSGAIKVQVEPEKMTYKEWSEENKRIIDNAIKSFPKIKAKEKEPRRMEIWAFDKNVYIANMGKINLRIIQPRYSENSNLHAQDGVFSYWIVKKQSYGDIKKGECPLLLDQETFDAKLVQALKEINAKEETYLYRITLPYEAAADLYLFAQRNGKDASNLFSGYDGVVRKIIEDKRMKILVHRK